MTQELTKALIKFQQEVPKIPFNSQVSYGTTKFKYADLASILETVRPLLNKHGFAVSQQINLIPAPNGQLHGVVETKLLHESGKELASQAHYDIASKPQDQGSGITYARRYAILGILGLVGEDDTDCVEQANKQAAPTKKNFADADWDNFRKALGEAKSAETLDKYAKAFAEKYKVTATRELEIKALVKSNKERLSA